MRALSGGQHEVFSAGTQPAKEVNPFALEALRERGIDDLSLHPKHITEFLDQPFDLVATLCDPMKEECVLPPRAREVLHWPMPDPAAFQGSYEEVLLKFIETRDLIEARIRREILGHQ